MKTVFYVIYREDAPEYGLHVSSRQFDTREEAETYRKGIAQSRNPIIAEGLECPKPTPPKE